MKVSIFDQSNCSWWKYWLYRLSSDENRVKIWWLAPTDVFSGHFQRVSSNMQMGAGSGRLISFPTFESHCNEKEKK